MLGYFKDIIAKGKKGKKDVGSLGVSQIVRTLWLEKKKELHWFLPYLHVLVS